MNAKNLRVDMFGMRITSHISYSKHWEKQWNDLERTIYTVGENIIATTKTPNNFCYPLKMVIFPILRYFSIAPHLVIALPTLR